MFESSFIQIAIPSWRSLVDLLTICIVSYSALRLTRLIRALRIAGLLGFVYGAGILAWHLDLPVTARVLQAWAVVLLYLVAIVFQPEIRRSLMKVDAFSLFGRSLASAAESRNQALAAASFLMARDKTGALMIIVNGIAVDDLTDGGVDLNADVSVALIRSLFQKQSPVHDGAVLIRGNTLLKAGVVLPLTDRTDVPASFGTRHRAAMGITERSDVLAVVVSEERGEVTLMSGHHRTEVRTEADLLCLLGDSLTPRRELTLRTLGALLTSDWKLKSAALLASALLVWGSSAVSGNSERTISVPVEFDNLGPGLDVAAPGVARIEIQVRGQSWIIDETGLSQLRVHLDLRGNGPGLHTLAVNRQALALPPGLRVVRVFPDTMAVRVEWRARQATQ